MGGDRSAAAARESVAKDDGREVGAVTLPLSARECVVRGIGEVVEVTVVIVVTDSLTGERVGGSVVVSCVRVYCEDGPSNDSRDGMVSKDESADPFDGEVPFAVTFFSSS